MMYHFHAAVLKGKKNAMLNPVFINKNVGHHQPSQVGDQPQLLRTISLCFLTWEERRDNP